MQRNVAFVDLAFWSALRRREIGTLLVTDLPMSVREEVPLAGAVAKQRRARRWRSSNTVLAEVHAYVRHARRDAITQARRTGRYDQLDPIWVADVQVGAKGMVLVLVDDRRWPVTEITERDRRRLFRTGADGLGERCKPTSACSPTSSPQQANAAPSVSTRCRPQVDRHDTVERRERPRQCRRDPNHGRIGHTDGSAGRGNPGPSGPAAW